MTFEEFLARDDGTGRDFELRDGLPMPIVYRAGMRGRGVDRTLSCLLKRDGFAHVKQPSLNQVDRGVAVFRSV
jgi:hypothetical protein